MDFRKFGAGAKRRIRPRSLQRAPDRGGTLRELLALAEKTGGEGNLDSLLDTRLSYVHAAGSPALRTAIAKLSGVESEHVQVVTGAEEALLILFFPAVKLGANIVVVVPGFPANAALAQSLGIETRFYRNSGG